MLGHSNERGHADPTAYSTIGDVNHMYFDDEEAERTSGWAFEVTDYYLGPVLYQVRAEISPDGRTALVLLLQWTDDVEDLNVGACQVLSIRSDNDQQLSEVEVREMVKDVISADPDATGLER